VVASRSNLLIAHASSIRAKIVPLVEDERGHHLFPLWWLVFSRFDDAQFLSTELVLAKVRSVRFRGIAGPRRLGAPFFSYFLLMTLGSLTLSLPVLLSFELEKIEEMNFSRVREWVVRLVQQNPNAYSHAEVPELLRRIKRAQDLGQIVESLSID
jgi:hypothetical protein